MTIRKQQSGLSLIEVLIALAVISIGLAGMAAMQMTTLQFVHSAHYRSMASTVALDFEERLWLELANDELTGCPNVTDATGSPVAELLAHWNRENVGGDGDWNWSSARMLKVPNLAIEVGTAVTGTSVTQIPITLRWCEDRFTDREDGADGDACGDANIEEFTYNVRILCRPEAGT